MSKLPQDGYILLSLANTFLRDKGSLEDFCAEYDCEEEEILSRLSELGYKYNEDENAFKKA